MSQDDPHWDYPSYDKIAESLERWLGDDEPAMRALRSVPWVATEKIHGANLCIASDGERVCIGKRKEWLADDDVFFGYRRATEPLHDAVRSLAASFGRRVFVYGELFGGLYPHPAVPTVPGLQPVQTGVSYAPDLTFLAFDVRVLDGDGLRWLPFDEARERMDAAAIPSVPALLRGTYADAIGMSLGFDSTIPALLGLPALPLGSNPAEGIVLSPVRPTSMRGRPSPIRPVIKRKIPLFEEDARFHQATAAPRRPRIEGALEALSAASSDLVCEPRLNAAISKLGRIDNEEMARAVSELLVEDVLDTLAETEPMLMQSLAPPERAALEEHICGEADALVALDQERARVSRG